MIIIDHVSVMTFLLTVMVEEVVKVMIEKTKVLEQKVSRLKSNIKRYLIGHLITQL